MPSPTLRSAPTADQLAAVDCPVDGFALISRLARTAGTLPKFLHRRRLGFLAVALASGEHTATEIASKSEMSISRVSQLAKLTRTLATPPTTEATS